MDRCVVFAVNYMPHQVAAVVELKKYYRVRLYHYKDTPGGIPDECSESIDITALTIKKVYSECKEWNPSVCIVPGWGTKKIVAISLLLKQLLSTRVVAYSDSQFKGGNINAVKVFLLRNVLKHSIDLVWVPGFYQYEYARRLGFSRDNIIFGSIRVGNHFLENSSNRVYNKLVFIYVGRFVEDKGLKELAEAWRQMDVSNLELLVIGKGPLGVMLSELNNVKVLDYMNHDELKHYYQSSHCFILPSKFEPWGVVVQEAALSGLPLLVSNKCGSAPHYVVDGVNGYTFSPNVREIKEAFLRIAKMDIEQLKEFGRKSTDIAQFYSSSLGVRLLVQRLEK